MNNLDDEFTKKKSSLKMNADVNKKTIKKKNILDKLKKENDILEEAIKKLNEDLKELTKEEEHKLVNKELVKDYNDDEELETKEDDIDILASIASIEEHSKKMLSNNDSIFIDNSVNEKGFSIKDLKDTRDDDYDDSIKEKISSMKTDNSFCVPILNDTNKLNYDENHFLVKDIKNKYNKCINDKLNTKEKCKDEFSKNLEYTFNIKTKEQEIIEKKKEFKYPGTHDTDSFLKNDSLFYKKWTDYLSGKTSNCDYRSPSLNDIKNHNCNRGPTFAFLRQQVLSADYINPKTPYRGLLLYHGLGSGKTLTAGAIIRNFFKYEPTRVVCVLATPGLISNFIKDLYKIPSYMLFDQKTTKYLEEEERLIEMKINKMDLTIQEKKDEIKKRVNYLKQIQITSKLVVLSYESWGNRLKGKTAWNESVNNEKIVKQRRLNQAPNKRYGLGNIISSSSTKTKVKDSKENPIFNNTLIIMDEAQELISPNDVGTLEHMKVIQSAIRNATDVKIIFMTATPYKKDPYELGILLNLLKPLNSKTRFPEFYKYDENLKCNIIDEIKTKNSFYDMFIENKNDALYLKNRNKLLEMCKGIISYFSIERDLSKFAEKIEENPINVPMSKEQYKLWKTNREIEFKQLKKLTTNKNCISVKDCDLSRKVALNSSSFKKTIKNYINKNKLNDIAPKIYIAANNIESLVSKGKQFVYSFYNLQGVYTLRMELRKRGWIEYIFDGNEPNTFRIEKLFTSESYSKKLSSIKDEEWINKADLTQEEKEQQYVTGGAEWLNIEEPMKKMKAFIVLGDTTDTKTKDSIVKSLFNRKKNMNGDFINCLIINKKYSEGISLKHVTNVHILEPPSSNSLREQIVARAVRDCSHLGLPFPDKWKVNIYSYYSVAPQLATYNIERYNLNDTKDKDKESDEESSDQDQLNYLYKDNKNKDIEDIDLINNKKIISLDELTTIPTIVSETIIDNEKSKQKSIINYKIKETKLETEEQKTEEQKTEENEIEEQEIEEQEIEEQETEEYEAEENDEEQNEENKTKESKKNNKQSGGVYLMSNKGNKQKKDSYEYFLESNYTKKYFQNTNKSIELDMDMEYNEADFKKYNIYDNDDLKINELNHSFLNYFLKEIKKKPSAIEENEKIAFEYRKKSAENFRLYKEEEKLSKEKYTNGDKIGAKGHDINSKYYYNEYKKAIDEAVKNIVEKQDWKNTKEIDLHGLLLKEAKKFTLEFLDYYEHKKINENFITLSIITGRGLHSKAGAVIKPEIIKLLNLKKNIFDLEELNKGGLLKFKLIPLYKHILKGGKPKKNDKKEDIKELEYCNDLEPEKCAIDENCEFVNNKCMNLSTDYSISKTADRIDFIKNSFLTVLKEASIECKVFKNTNDLGLKCYEDYENENETQSVVENGDKDKEDKDKEDKDKEDKDKDKDKDNINYNTICNLKKNEDECNKESLCLYDKTDENNSCNFILNEDDLENKYIFKLFNSTNKGGLSIQLENITEYIFEQDLLEIFSNYLKIKETKYLNKFIDKVIYILSNFEELRKKYKMSAMEKIYYLKQNYNSLWTRDSFNKYNTLLKTIKYLDILREEKENERIRMNEESKDEYDKIIDMIQENEYYRPLILDNILDKKIMINNIEEIDYIFKITLETINKKEFIDLIFSSFKMKDLKFTNIDIKETNSKFKIIKTYVNGKLYLEIILFINNNFITEIRIKFQRKKENQQKSITQTIIMSD